jgi:hypothetical protein
MATTNVPTGIKPFFKNAEPPARRLHVQMKWYRQAMNFECAAGIINEWKTKNIAAIPKGLHPDIPIVMNHAFAVELYLKCLLIIEDRSFAWVHDLRELFDLLLHHHRDRIEYHYMEWRKAQTNFFSAATSGLLIADILGRTNLAFDEWRYLHEERPDKNTNIIAGKPYDAAILLPHIKTVISECIPNLESFL